MKPKRKHHHSNQDSVLVREKIKYNRTETRAVVVDFRERERDWSGVRACQEALKIEVFISFI